MDEDIPKPEPAEPRFLLPDGGKDLIDAFPKAKQGKKMIYFYDHEGNSLGPPEELPKPETIAAGLSALPGYVSRLFTSATPFGLLVFTGDDQRGFGISRLELQTQIFISLLNGETDLEQCVRAFFEDRAMTPAHDELSEAGITRSIAYLVPQSPEAVATLCRALLIDCFEVQPDDTLHFMLA